MQDDSYKTIILEINESHISQLVQNYEADIPKKLKTEDEQEDEKIKI